VRALQLNLCDSGIATCFTGGSVAAAAVVVRHQRPDIVTLNEVCRGDVFVLKRTMSAIHPGATVVAVFKPAADRPANGPFRCLNGERYGIGLLASIPSPASEYRAYGGTYPMQDPADPEERVWLCLDVAGGFLACTTHAASTNSSVALAQCRYLMQWAVPGVRAHDRDAAVVVGADLNLAAGRSPGPQACLPDGYQRVDDGSRQDFMTGPGIALVSRTIIDMQGSTDHPGLFVELALARPRPATR
jgi:hypothetical protein